MQSLDEPRLVFALLEPFLFYPDYGFELPDPDSEALGIVRPEDAIVRCVLTLHDGLEETTANMVAPLVLNQATGRGRQVVLQDANLPLRFAVFESLQLPRPRRPRRSGHDGKEAAMLILTRKLKQAIIVDGDTSIRVLSIERDRVKLGIDAPRSVSVLREELLEQVAGQNRRAARPDGGTQLVDRFRSMNYAGDAPPQRLPDDPPPAS